MLILAATDQPGQAGPLGLFVIVLLAVATLLLVRSMRRHLRRIPSSFDPSGPASSGRGEPAADDPADDPTSPSA